VPVTARVTGTRISHPPGGVRVSAIFALSRFVVARRIGQTSQLEHIRKTRQRLIRFGGDATKVTALLGRCIFIFHDTYTLATKPNFLTLIPAPRSGFVHPVDAENSGQSHDLAY
jgi:hypothetical protein